MDVENRIPATIVASRPRQTKRARKPAKNKQPITRKPKSQDSSKSKHNDFKHVCRICLLAEDDNMVAMTSKIGSDCVADMFHSITSIEVDLEDSFPLSICGTCHSKLIDCYGFKIKCLESNSILQSKIGTKNNGSKKVFSIAGKNDKEIQTCVEDFIIVDTKKDDTEKEKNFVNFDDAYKTEAVDDDDNDDNDEEIEFLEDDSYIEEPIIKQEIEKQIQQITYNFLKERKNQKSHKQFSCSSCLKKFLKLKSLRAHVKVCSEAIKREFTCSQCSECFDSEHDLKIHSAVHVKGSEWKCIECEKEFTERSRFRRHIRRHMATMKRWSCAACGKAFAERSALRRHERVHTGETPVKRFRCDQCDKRFADSNQLREHSAKHTGERPCACEVCGKAFASSRLLASHRRVHSDYLPYECSYCHKRFRMKATLKTHHRTHTGERPYTCTICGKGFIQASNLSLHMRVHTGEKPYSCEVCGRKFAAGSTLAVHMRVHTGEKPYGCPICGKRFARTDIKPHMRLHTGERPYACTACLKRFVSPAALREHSVVHTGERRFQCTLCPEEYKKKIYLMNHIDKVHSKKRDVLIKVAPYTTDFNDKINKLDCENKNQTLDADEIPLDDTEELILPVDSDVMVKEQDNINCQNNNDARLNEVAFENNSNIIEEGEINESDSIHEGTTVKVYQLDKSLLQIQAAGGHVTVRKITTKMISDY